MQDKKKLSLLSLTMLNITAIISLSSIAYMATIGLQSITFYLVAAVMFLIPSALVCAELSSMMTENNGGIFTWVKEALGEKAGMVAMWLEWFNNAISFPGTISAAVASVAYVGFRSVMGSGVELWLIMVIVFWIVTLFNFLPMKRVVILNVVGAIFGMILPGVLLVSGAIYYILHGQSHITYHGLQDLVPVASLATFALLVKTLSAYSGIQSVAFHMKNIDHPRKNIPISMLVATVIIVSLTILATVSLMVIIPVDKVNVLNGLVQGISAVLATIGLKSMEPVVALLVGLGMLAAISTWILGPARGMQEAAEQQLFPKIMAGQNKAGMPVNMLMIQVFVGMVLSSVFLVMPSIYSAFALLIALTSQFTVLMWSMVFISAIRLRYTQSDRERIFHIGPRGKNWVLILVVVMAVTACALGFVSGLFPPGFSRVKSIGWYIMLIAIADIIIILIPLSWVWLHHRRNIMRKHYFKGRVIA